MKTNRQHRVPLCGRALEILDAAEALGEGAGPLVFTHGGGRPLDDKQLRWMVRELGIAAVPHGFRSSFRDWAGREDRSSQGGDRGGPGACGPEPCRGRLCPIGPVRAPAHVDERLGALPGPRIGGGSGALGVNRPRGSGRLHRRRGCASERVAGLQARNNTRTSALFDTLKALSQLEAAGMETPCPRPGKP